MEAGGVFREEIDRYQGVFLVPWLIGEALTYGYIVEDVHAFHTNLGL